MSKELIYDLSLNCGALVRRKSLGMKLHSVVSLDFLYA